MIRRIKYVLLLVCSLVVDMKSVYALGLIIAACVVLSEGATRKVIFNNESLKMH